jgi:hypothetical protein
MKDLRYDSRPSEREEKSQFIGIRALSLVGTPEDNIRIDLRETVQESVDWMHLAQYRHQWQTVVNTVMKLRVP